MYVTYSARNIFCSFSYEQKIFRTLYVSLEKYFWPSWKIPLHMLLIIRVSWNMVKRSKPCELPTWHISSKSTLSRHSWIPWIPFGISDHQSNHEGVTDSIAFDIFHIWNDDSTASQEKWRVTKSFAWPFDISWETIGSTNHFGKSSNTTKSWMDSSSGLAKMDKKMDCRSNSAEEKWSVQK